jgi:hypothetical protein
MLKSKDILIQKAKEVKSLKAAIEDDKTEESREDLHPKVIVNEDGKKILVFNDPLYSREKRSIINYAVFKGKWEFENIDEIDENDSEKCAVKFAPIKDLSNMTIAFKSLKDRVEFMDSIYSDNEMKQVGTGINLERLANSKVLKATGGLIGLSLAGYRLYKLLKKDPD